IRDAGVNARINGLENMTFHCADAGEMTARLAAEGEEADVMFMDPPRAGLGRDMLDAVEEIAPKRLVYVSCNPETLAKDLDVLRRSYKVEKIQPVDMFPRTQHCECVVFLTRK
ncbi:MAG: 23S rRNA (uracil(1939)-C(5))-methyltransferase RlmD, partial [Clostridia bacterium]|nr:23S rRNA (uracil(1939)-C(5))-methyltransferase RlmD [Clostridia bacterium]